MEGKKLLIKSIQENFNYSYEDSEVYANHLLEIATKEYRELLEKSLI